MKSAFKKYADFVLFFTIAVIMWGSYVRATGSGAGCGSHWPTCQGSVVPLEPTLKTWIEFSHRLTSGLSLLFVIGLWIAARRIFGAKHTVSKAGGASFVFILGEAMVGAMLVLLRLVENDASTLRAVVIALHLVNTFLLLFWLGEVSERARVSLNDEFGSVNAEVAASARKAQLRLRPWMVFYMLIGAMGAIVALGDTLFPAESLRHGLEQDLSPSSHFLIKLRVIHPILAVAGSVMIWRTVLTSLEQLVTLRRIETITRALLIGLVVQLSLGVLNWVLMAPVWLQMMHLVVADLVWMALVKLNFEYKHVSKLTTT